MNVPTERAELHQAIQDSHARLADAVALAQEHGADHPSVAAELASAREDQKTLIAAWNALAGVAPPAVPAPALETVATNGLLAAFRAGATETPSQASNLPSPESLAKTLGAYEPILEGFIRHILSATKRPREEPTQEDLASYEAEEAAHARAADLRNLVVEACMIAGCLGIHDGAEVAAGELAVEHTATMALDLAQAIRRQAAARLTPKEPSPTT